MEQQMKLFMVLLGSTPAGRHTEQHDVFFGIGESLGSLKNDMLAFWPEAGESIHIDGWREINFVNGNKITVAPAADPGTPSFGKKLFFINLGGYKENEFEEFHYKMVVAAADKGEAIRQSKQTTFYKHTGFKGAESHVDDKFGIDVDDAYDIADILPLATKNLYRIEIAPDEEGHSDILHLGYIIFSKF